MTHDQIEQVVYVLAGLLNDNTGNRVTLALINGLCLMAREQLRAQLSEAPGPKPPTRLGLGELGADAGAFPPIGGVQPPPQGA